MTKTRGFLLAVALATTFSFAQEEEKKEEEKKTPNSGIRFTYSLYDYSTGNSDIDKYIDMGYGFGIGKVGRGSNPRWNAATEWNFLYRKPFSMKIGDVESWVEEFALNGLLMARFTPVEIVAFYAGVQLEGTLISRVAVTGKSEDYYFKTGHWGFPLGIGFFVTQNLELNFRTLILIMAEMGSEHVGLIFGDDHGYISQYNFGVTYYY